LLLLQRAGPTIQPFCYYCDREFDDETTLIQHQKAKHFQCAFCFKKMTTVGALVIHASQVHKETLRAVPNSKEGRDSLDMQVYGMENVPDELLVANTKRTRMTQGEVDAEGGAAQGPGGGPMPYNGGMHPGGSI
jgi:hypothetical protein